MISTLPQLTASLAIPHPAVNTRLVDYSSHQDMIHAIRRDVFVCEQAIPADCEVDQYDPISHHVLAWWQGAVVGTGRLTPGGRIGRVAVLRPMRRQGVGRCIVETLLATARCQQHDEVMLAAQWHAIPFYERLGFQSRGPVFQELGIAHVMMYKSLG